MLDNEGLILQQAQAGDQEAIAAIFDTHYASVFTYIFFRVGDRALAEDLTSEVFTRMVSKLGSFIWRGRPVLAWLYTIAHNLVVLHYRGSQNSARPFEEESLPSSNGNQPDEHVESLIDQECLVKAVRQLTSEQQQVILLKFIEGRSNAEIAGLLGKTEGAVKSLQHRALSSLQRALKRENCYET